MVTGQQCSPRSRRPSGAGPLSTDAAQNCYNLARCRVSLVEPLAQLVEHLTFNQGVLGSIPRRLTNFKHLEVTPSGCAAVWYQRAQVWRIRYSPPRQGTSPGSRYHDGQPAGVCAEAVFCYARAEHHARDRECGPRQDPREDHQRAFATAGTQPYLGWTRRGSQVRCVRASHHQRSNRVRGAVHSRRTVGSPGEPLPSRLLRCMGVGAQSTSPKVSYRVAASLSSVRSRDGSPVHLGSLELPRGETAKVDMELLHAACFGHFELEFELELLRGDG